MAITFPFLNFLADILKIIKFGGKNIYKILFILYSIYVFGNKTGLLKN